MFRIIAMVEKSHVPPPAGQFAWMRRRSAFCGVAPGPKTAGFASTFRGSRDAAAPT
jgi:hypothetical protein